MHEYQVTVDEVLTYRFTVKADCAEDAADIAQSYVQHAPAKRDAALIARTNVEVMDVHPVSKKGE